jgi:hypothetical protein
MVNGGTSNPIGSEFISFTLSFRLSTDNIRFSNGVNKRIRSPMKTRGLAVSLAYTAIQHPNLKTLMVRQVCYRLNFPFVSGNSGGPIFDAENGRAFAYVKGLHTPKINEFVDSAQIQLPANIQKEYIADIRAVYSIGLTLDRVRDQLEQFGVQLLLCH